MNWLKEYFTFTKSQRIGIYGLLAIISILTIVRLLMPYLFKSESSKNDTAFFNSLKSLQQDTTNKYQLNKVYETITEDDAVAMLKLHSFNPNTIDSNEFVAMGFRPKLIHTILNARRKNWHFYNAESFEKMYGLCSKEFEKIKPFISIPPQKYSSNQTSTFAKNYNNSTENQIKKTTIKVVELNSCDTTLLIQLPMIGSKLANNIIKYRSLLGGYASIDQLNEVYGLQPQTFEIIKPYIKLNASNIQKINLNEATYDELKKHPYMKVDVLNAILNLLKEKKYHFDSLEQLKEIELINDETFRKIAYYFEVK